MLPICCQVYDNLEFLRPLIDAMTRTNPSDRPTSKEALAQFKQLKLPKWGTSLRWRLRSRDETSSQRLIGDAMAVIRESTFVMRSIVTAPMKMGRRLVPPNSSSKQ